MNTMYRGRMVKHHDLYVQPTNARATTSTSVSAVAHQGRQEIAIGTISAGNPLPFFDQF